MTVTLLKPYGAFAQNTTVELDAATESSLVTQGVAKYVINPGTSGFTPLSASEQQQLRDSGLGQISPKQRRPSVVLLGDSRWAQGYSSSATNVSRYQEGAFHVANALAKNRYKVLNDSGVGGNTLSDMVARFGTDVLPYAPKYCFIKGGINSLQTQYASLSATRNFESTRDDALNLINLCLNAGIIPVIGTEGSKGTPVAAQLAATMRYNDWLRQNSSVYGFQVWDYAMLAIDPATSAAYPRNAATWWRDGTATGTISPLIHTGNLGAYYEGLLLSDLLTSLEPAQPRLITGYEDYTNNGGAGYATYSNLLDNPTFQGTSGTNSTSGGIVGNVPTSWTLAYQSGTPGGTCALVNVNDSVTGQSLGQAFELTMSSGATGNGVNLNSANLSSRVTAGTQVSAQCVVQLVTANNVQWVQVMARADPGGGGQAVAGGTGGGTYSNGGTGSTSTVQPMIANTYYYESPRFTIPANVVNVSISLRVQFNGDPTGTVIRLWSPRLRVE